MSDTSSNDGDSSTRGRRRGIYLLPNLFTTATLFGGFYAIISAINGHFEAAAIGIFAGMVADTLDGRVARLTGTESDFGKEYDSLSDMVTFGLSAAVVMYIWALQHLPDALTYGGKLAWLAAFFYVACTGLRLARFNVSVEKSDKGWFLGLPSPSGAGLTAGFVWVCETSGISGESAAVPAFVITVFAAVLMVSNVRFYSFKALPLGEKVPFLYVLAVIGIFVLISLDPPKVAFAVFLTYALSGPLLAALRWRRKRRMRAG